MTYYHRQGVFRRRLILPRTQRALEALSLPAIAQATLTYEAAAHATGASVDNGVITLGPVTVESAVGQERLVIVGGLSESASTVGGDFKACTVDGQVATRVGSVSRAFPSSGSRSTFMTAFRAPGTSNTSIVISVTVGSAWPGSTVTAASAACFRMQYAGTLRAQTGAATNDPTLDANTIVNGAAAAGLYGYAGGGGAGSVPVFRSLANTTYGSRTDSTVCDAPAGAADGDILLAGVFAAKSGDDIASAVDIQITPPAGWTQIGTDTAVFSLGFCGTLRLYWKRASSEGGVPYTFTHVVTGSGSTFSTQAAIAAYSGCIASGNPVDVFSQNAASTGSTATATGVTTTSANTKLVYLGHNWDASTTLTPPTGMTERYDHLTYVSDEDRASAGATSDRTQALASSNPWAAFLVALKPIAGGAGTGALTAWTGLTERYDIETFSAASANIVATSTPLAISANLTPDLNGSADSVASLALSFNPVPVATVAALSGSYVLSGTNAGFRRSMAAASGSYLLSGTNATLGNAKFVTVAPAGYVLVGIDADIDPSASAIAAIVFDATDTDTADKASGTYTFPLTVVATGGERLVVVGGIAGTDGDYSACTVDGQAGTRVGFVSRGVADSSGYTPFLTAFRAPVTANTSINVVATIGGSLKTQTSAYCACFNMSGVGSVFATTNSNSNDPTLSTDVANNGAVVAALLGYADTTPTVTWSGLVERFDLSLGTDVFSGASIDVSAAAVPTFRAESHSVYSPFTGQTLLVKPTGTADGDILIATIFTGASGLLTWDDMQITPPTGWTQIGTVTSVVDSGNFRARLWVYWKRAASEPSGWDWLHTGAVDPLTTQGTVAAYSGCTASGNPVDVFAQNSASTGSTATATAITTTVASTKIVYTGHNWDGTAALTPPTGMTERVDSVVYLADMDFAGPGSVGPFTQGLASSNPWGAFTIALKPASSPRPISADVTPDLATAGSDSIASICLSFVPGGASGDTILAAPGAYAIVGTPAVTKRGFKTFVTTTGSYTLIGTAASALTSVRKVVAETGSYVLTGQPVATLRGGTNKFIDATAPGSYAIAGTAANPRRGRKIVITTIGSYGITGTTVVTGKGLIAAGGSYALTGTNAVPVKGFGGSLGAEMIVNGTFGSGASWVLQPGITVSGGQAVFTSVALNNVLRQNLTMAAGMRYRIVFSIVSQSAGAVRPILVGATVVNGTVRSGIGTYTEDLVAPVSPVYVAFQSAAVGTTLTLDNASMKPVIGSISISIGGNQMLASSGTVTASGGTGLGISVTGNQMLASSGTATVSAQGSVSVLVDATGNQALVSVGNASTSIVGGVQTVFVTGPEMTAYVGNAAGIIPGQAVIAAPDAMLMGVGTVLIDRSGSVNVLPIGNYVTMGMGTLDGGLGEGTITTGNNISVTGDPMTVEMGSVTTGSNVSAEIDSDNNLDISAEVGTVTVTAKQNVAVDLTGNAMQSYVGKLRFVGGGTVVLFPDTTKEGQMLKPSNWMGG